MQQQELVVEKAPVIVAPFHATPKTPQEMAEGYSTVTMEFPNPVHLTVDHNNTVYYPKGTHEVPEHLAEHWFLQANGARQYSRPVAVKAPVPAAKPKAK